MRITYLLGSVGNTGGNIVLFHHMEALAEQGHEVIILTPYGRQCWKRGMLNKISNSPTMGYLGGWGVAKRIQHWIKKHMPPLEKYLMSIYSNHPLQRANSMTTRLIGGWEQSDITIATHSFTAHAAALLSNRTRAFYHMQGYEPWFSQDIDFQAVSEISYYLPLQKIANCIWLRDKVQKFSKHQVGLVRPGVNHKIFNPKRDICKKYSNIKEFHIVSYADPRPLKGWMESVAAMKKVFKSLSDKINIKWSVFGSIAMGNIGLPVNYCGYLSHSQLSDLYSSAHLVFVPSWLESFPLQPLESMACGATVLTTHIGTEDYARHEETAWVITPRDVNALGEAITKLLQKPEILLRLAINGLKESKKYTWENSFNELCSILKID